MGVREVGVGVSVEGGTCARTRKSQQTEKRGRPTIRWYGRMYRQAARETGEV